MGYVRPLIFFTFLDFGHLHGVTGVGGGGGGQSWTKKANFGFPVSIKIENFQTLFKHCLFLLNYYLWWKFQQNWTVFEGERTQKLPQKDNFMDAESVRKGLKNFNLTNYECYTNKTYQDYLHKIFNLVKIWGIGCKRAYTKSILEWAIKSASWLNFYEHSGSSNNHNICYALPHIESLAKILYKLNLIWRSNPWKNHPK